MGVIGTSRGSKGEWWLYNIVPWIKLNFTLVYNIMNAYAFLMILCDKPLQFKCQ